VAVVAVVAQTLDRRVLVVAVAVVLVQELRTVLMAQQILVAVAAAVIIQLATVVMAEAV
jgi:hypothetical protein